MSNITLEIIGTLFGLACVLATLKRNIVAWPLGIISVIALGTLYWRIQLYPDMALQIFFAISSLYGWSQWNRHKQLDNKINPLTLNKQQRVQLLIVVCILWSAISGFALLFKSAFPLWNSAIAALSLVAQLLLTRRFIESWLLWIVVDIIAIVIYSQMQIYYVTALYVLFLILATGGLISWNKHLKKSA